MANERLLETGKRSAQSLGRVVLVVQMDLHLAKARTAKPGQRVEILFLVFLDRKEEGVTRRPTVRIAKLPELPRELLDPRCDALAPGGDVGLAPLGLIVVGQAQEDVDFLVRSLDEVLAAAHSFPGPFWEVGSRLAKNAIF